MQEIPRIGTCLGCGRCGRLVNEGCPDCRRQFGPKAGLVLDRIRKDPIFAAMCYEQCDPDRKRRFVELFGLPEGCETVDRHPILTVVSNP
jgi:hypothetical protein